MQKSLLSRVNDLRKIILLPLLGLAAISEAQQIYPTPDGRLYCAENKDVLFSLRPFVAGGGEISYGKALAGSTEESAQFTLGKNDQTLNGTMTATQVEDKVVAEWKLKSLNGNSGPSKISELGLIESFEALPLVGGYWQTDTANGYFFPSIREATIFKGLVKYLTLTFPDGKVITLNFPNNESIMISDDRPQASKFTLKIGFPQFVPQGKLAPGKEVAFKVAVSTQKGAALGSPAAGAEMFRPIRLQADDEWIPLVEDVEIASGSALDLSGCRFTDGPCGSKGRVTVNSDGHFAYSGDPGTPRRFFGVNFCFGSQFLGKEKVDAILDRIVRLGFNSVRVHHYENQLTKKVGDAGFDWDPEKIDQLDYFIAGCKKRGLWITTDLLVNRTVSGKQIGRPEEIVWREAYKVLIPVYEPAFQDWAKFSRKFLDHVNPYTGTRLGEEPTIAWISLVNEGPYSNRWGMLTEMPDWISAWNQWLVKQYPTRQALADALGDLGPDEDAQKGTVSMPKNLEKEGKRPLIGQVFVAEMEKNTYERMRNFLRKDLKCHALLTNMNNSGPRRVPLQLARDAYDYVDLHFYIDHPEFPETAWRLPSVCPNTNPIKAGAPGGASSASVRLWGKPFTVSEYSYSGPGQYRGVGGILMGVLGGFQNWDAMWSFTYSSSDKALFEPDFMGYFDLVSDPLAMASTRLTSLLYLRKDIRAADHNLAVTIPRSYLENLPQQLQYTGLQRFSWVTGIGCLLTNDQQNSPDGYIPVPIQVGGSVEAITDALRDQGVRVPRGGITRSDTGEFMMNTFEGTVTVDTPKSGGGYADPGRQFACPTAGVEVDQISFGATIFVNSLSEDPIKNSRRLLVTHLTDLQNTDIQYAEGLKQTLTSIGRLPHLVRAGEARVRIALDQPEKYSVWALSVGGKRLEVIPSQVEDGKLVFKVDVRGQTGARLLYEVAFADEPGPNKPETL